MASTHVIQFYAISQLFKNRDRQLKRGEIAYNDGHVVEMDFDGTLKPALLKGVVHASQRKEVKYRVEIRFDEDSGFDKDRCSCTCAVGQDVCHHMAALLFYAHYNVSSTDIECRWRAPKKKGVETIKSLEQMFPLKEPYKALTKQLSEDDVNNFKRRLGDTSIVGFSWLLKPEVPIDVYCLIPSIEDILYSEAYIKAQDKEEFFKRSCAVVQSRIKEIHIKTIGQHSNEAWLVCRKLRLTSSKFGVILNACRRNSFPPSLYKNLLEGYDLHRVKAVQWGKDNEKTALLQFKSLTGFEVVPSGLWLDECGFLGTSPDGLINEDSVLEIKCPYKYRDGILKERLQEKKDYFYYYNDDNELVVKVDHIYYHQVQGQLFLTGREKCYFFIWTPIEFEILLIEKDPEWRSNIEILKDFYIHKFIPYVCKGV